MSRNLKVRIYSVFISAFIITLFGFFEKWISIRGLKGSIEYEEEIYNALTSAIIIPFVYFVPIYLILGIPVSYLMDYIVNRMQISSLWKNYFVKLIYSIFIAFLLSLILAPQYDYEAFRICLIAVLVYLHVLIIVRKDYKNEVN